jgi:serine/threonine protein kinase
MGEVYLAQDARLGRRVALKLLPACFTRDEAKVRRFEQEARAASALNHPNIITIYEIGQAEGIHFIVGEFVDGCTLRELLARRQMTLTEALDIAIQAANALQAAHEARIVHRDVKPENLMLRRDGYVKVLDFGLAKLTEPQGVESDASAPAIGALKTNAGVVMGTANYMSPEQARGLAVDERTDIFSFDLRNDRRSRTVRGPDGE